MRDSGTVIIKWTMVLIYSALSMIVLTFVLALLVPLAMNPNHYKGQIAALVLEKSGRNLTLDGDVEWELFPNPTITLKEVTLSNASGFRAEPMVRMRRVQGRLTWQQLWRGQWLLQQPVITGLDLLLERDQAGRNNWDGLLNRLQGETATGQGAGDTLPSPIRQATQLLAVLLDRAVTIKDGTVRLCRPAAETSACTVLKNLAFTPPGSKTAAEPALQMHGELQLLEPALHGQLAVRFQSMHAAEANHIQWRNLEMSWRGQVALPPAKEVELSWRSDVNLALDTLRLQMEQVDSHVTVWSEAALFREMNFALRGAAHADVQAGTVQLPQGGLLWRIKSDQLPPAGMAFALQSAMAVDWRQERLELAAMQMIGPAQSRIEGSVHATALLSQPQISAQLTNIRFDPRALLLAMGRSVPAIADPTAMRTGSGSANIDLDGQHLSISAVSLEMDGTHWRGELNWQAAQQSSAPAQVHFQLHGDRWELDRYLPSEWIGPQQSAWISRTLLAPEWLLLEMAPGSLPSIALQGRLEVDELLSMAAPASGLSLQIAMQEHQLQFQPYRIALHNGVLESRVQWDERGAEPTWQIEKRLNGLQMEPLLRVLGNNTSGLTGGLNGLIQLHSQGRQWESWWENLRGSYALTLQDGQWLGVDLTERFREGARQGRESWSAVAEKGGVERRVNTSFTQISGSGRIVAGVLENSDLLLSAPTLQGSGRGSVDLRRGMMDYTLEVESTPPVVAGVTGGQRMILPVRWQGEVQSGKGPVLGPLRTVLPTP
ncbi:MAG: AsmA family protein [Magnetococcales bacterium]|nr:AsmA family protein [Magnetococcales bacterium]MBF0114867.1 AsmA family protein [Magnetococcales bacterium]